MEDTHTSTLYNYFPVEYVSCIPLKLSSVGKYSISKPWLSRKIVNIMKQYIGDLSTKVITDATANNGGDTIRFSKHFQKVHSIELDSLEYSYLKNNVESYQCDNVNLYQGDCRTVISTLTQDLIYIDPPWGGEEYRSHKKLDLYLGNTHVIDFVKSLKDRCTHCIIKIPYNFNIDTLSDLSYRKLELTRTVSLLIIALPQ